MAFGFLNLPKAKWWAALRQVILKADFQDIETALLEAHGLIQVPNIAWVDTTAVKVPATADCPAAVLMSGFPNILHPGGMVSGGLSDGKYRTNVADTTMDFDVAPSFWGAEKVSQWYAIFALAADADAVFTIKAMPFMRVKSQATQTISLGNLTTPATGIGYGFTTDALIGGMVYVLSGASKGLIRAITANNNDNGTGGTITYSGAALTLAAGDWFVVLPPGTNFRWLGDIFNNSSGNLVQFDRTGNQVNWLAPITIAAPTTTPTEDITCAPPLAVALGVQGHLGTTIGHPDGTNYISLGSSESAIPTLEWAMRVLYADVIPTYVWTDPGGHTGEDQTIVVSKSTNQSFAESPIKNCKYKGAGAAMIAIYFQYPPGCGY